MCDSIQPNHAITAYMEFPEGYYEGVEKVQYFWHYLWLALTVVCILVIVFRALTIDRGRNVVKTIEFYPPEGISSAEVGVIIDNSASFDLPYMRVPHPKYKGKRIPAYDMIKFSVNMHRGCFGGCAFCTMDEIF